MRELRIYAPGEHFHVFNRGHHRAVIFKDDRDRRYFLSKLDEFCTRDHVTILAYCLMDNHFHLALRQNGTVPISVTMRALLMGYVRAYNKRHRKIGGLFQGRHQAVHIRDEYQMARVSRYIHRNPHPHYDYLTYRWSSIAEYLHDQPGICDTRPVMDWFHGSKSSYTTFLENPV